MKSVILPSPLRASTAGNLQAPPQHGKEKPRHGRASPTPMRGAAPCQHESVLSGSCVPVRMTRGGRCTAPNQTWQLAFQFILGGGRAAANACRGSRLQPRAAARQLQGGGMGTIAPT